VMTVRVPFEQALLDITGGNKRLLTTEYMSAGAIPVIDQGQSEIAGFTDDLTAVCSRHGSVILFGDHTRTLKFVDFDFALGADGVKVLKPLPGFDARFLFHFLRTVRIPENLGYSRHFKFLKESSVPKPALDVQRHIASILDKADSLYRKRKEAILLMDELLKAMFYDMFGDPVTNPKGFPTIRIDQLCEVATGSTPARNRADYYDGPHPWIKTGEVDTPLIMSAEEHISDDALRETNCKLFPIGTLLIAMYGQGKTRGKVGMLGIPAATNQACAAILPSQNVDRQFLHTQLTLMYEHLRAMGRGGNQENLNLGMIKSLEVLIPPSHLVDEFIKILNRVNEMRSKTLCARMQSEAILQSLAAKFFA
jgi:type I restriction enzyme S subunit